MVDRRPLLFFPTPSRRSLPERRGFPIGGRVHIPSYERQQRRVSNLLQDIEAAFESSLAQLSDNAAGAYPENVLVFELVGSIEQFRNQARKIEGLDWLAEVTRVQGDPDEDFFDEADPSKPLDQTLYLLMTSRGALRRIESLFRDYQRNEGKAIEYGYGAWRELFSQVRDIRFWDRRDRIRGSFLEENIKFELEHRKTSVRIKAELWFSDSISQREKRLSQLRSALDQSDGKIIRTTVIPEIRYHGVIFEVSSDVARALLDQDFDLPFINTSSVRYFSATGQFKTPPHSSYETEHFRAFESVTSVVDQPVVAALDGMPLENHPALRGRLIVDDPNDWAEDYLAEHRVHGTAMASLIIHGDLEIQDDPIETPLYIQPIMRAGDRGDGHFIERIPTGVDEVDFVHMAFRRMFDEVNGEPAACPTVQVVNFSIGNESEPYDREISPMARLLDWLAWRYNVLIVVSAGNNYDPIRLDSSIEEFENMTPAEREKRVVASLVRQSQQRRILSPGEALNVLTVGSLHSDATNNNEPLGFNVDPLLESSRPSPLSRIGSGHEGSIKPDIMHPGGRQWYRLKPGSPSDQAVIGIIESLSPPGQQVAYPRPMREERNAVAYTRGTSNATALVTRQAARAILMLKNQKPENATDDFDDYLPVLGRALVVHGSEWDTSAHQFRELMPAEDFVPHIRHYYGFGSFDSYALQGCTSSRATLLGYGAFEGEGSHEYELPIPSLLCDSNLWKRLVITLSWFSPMNANRAQYRGSSLTIRPSNTEIASHLGVVNSKTAGIRDSRRGTLQHLVLEGRAVRPTQGELHLPISVDCRPRPADVPLGLVRYGLVVTIEARESSGVQVYEDIALRIQQRVRESVTIRA